MSETPRQQPQSLLRHIDVWLHGFWESSNIEAFVEDATEYCVLIRLGLKWNSTHTSRYRSHPVAIDNKPNANWMCVWWSTAHGKAPCTSSPNIHPLTTLSSFVLLIQRIATSSRITCTRSQLSFHVEVLAPLHPRLQGHGVQREWSAIKLDHGRKGMFVSAVVIDNHWFTSLNLHEHARIVQGSGGSTSIPKTEQSSKTRLHCRYYFFLKAAGV